MAGAAQEKALEPPALRCQLAGELATSRLGPQLDNPLAGRGDRQGQPVTRCDLADRGDHLVVGTRRDAREVPKTTDSSRRALAPQMDRGDHESIGQGRTARRRSKLGNGLGSVEDFHDIAVGY